ncbi:hypothetical protein [Nonomuraea bangladeshensis]|uniref:hypothetical protein n=1 Tax=Nonomuraea bangladeshensis TaxID=404385 RepID=UPI003C2F9659
MEQNAHSGGEDAQTELLRDWADRQLSTLRHTYPSWEIEREPLAGALAWQAALLHNARSRTRPPL